MNDTSSDGNKDGVAITKWFNLSEIPIYIQSGAVIVKQPFDKRMAVGANKEYYSHLRFDISDFVGSSDGSSNYMGDIRVFEDEGISIEYLSSSGGDDSGNYVQTQFSYVFDISNHQFSANITSIGIENVFPAVMDSVMCNNTKVEFNYL